MHGACLDESRVRVLYFPFFPFYNIIWMRSSCFVLLLLLLFCHFTLAVFLGLSSLALFFFFYPPFFLLFTSFPVSACSLCGAVLAAPCVA